MKQQDVFASTQIITFNPILNESADIRTQYFMYLKRLIHLVRWDKRKYTKAQIDFYKDALCNSQEIPKGAIAYSFDSRFCYLLPYDLTIMLGFHPKVMNSDKTKVIVNKIVTDFSLPEDHAKFLLTEFEAAMGGKTAWEEVFRSKHIRGFKKYLNLVKRNICFVNTKPYNILITATMSAGKSTLINSLVGKNITLMQNMACTSKIHTIVSKPMEDGVTSEYDHDLSLDASREDLLSDNVDNKSSKITVGTYFNSELAGKRIILFDSPGVNSSENIEHTEISQQIIKSRRYKLMMYVLNATQLGTTDEEHHLEIVKERLGRAKIIFIMNKVDQLLSEDDSFLDSIEGQRKFLISKGFKNPIICPVSSRAAYLVKKNKQEELSRLERREMENYMDKFEQQSLSEYYEKQLKCSPISTDNETDALFANCGFAYFEKIIANIHDGGKKYGSSIC